MRRLTLGGLVVVTGAVARACGSGGGVTGPGSTPSPSPSPSAPPSPSPTPPLVTACLGSGSTAWFDGDPGAYLWSGQGYISSGGTWSSYWVGSAGTKDYLRLIWMYSGVVSSTWAFEFSTH